MTGPQDGHRHLRTYFAYADIRFAYAPSTRNEKILFGFSTDGYSGSKNIGGPLRNVSGTWKHPESIPVAMK